MERFGPYEVHQRLGVGGMATVHLALERGVEGFERWVALKRLLPHLGADEEFVRSFIREAQLASRLSHPNIVRIFELGRVGEDYFISMEYIEGRDIRLLLRRARKVAGPPPLQVFVSLLSELLDALDYAHRKTDTSGNPLGLVHRDVSPSNLLVTTSGHLKIIDFGIARASSEKQLTATGKIKGKIAYMAPEALRGRRRDARSDLFSVGVIAHELLTARPLFAAKNDYRTIERIQNDEVLPPSSYNTNCPPAVDDFVLEALAKEPDDRFQSARDMLERLEALGQELSLHATGRDVAGWVDWAFSLPIPKRSGTQDATVELPGRKVAANDADDELLDIIWANAGGPKEPVKIKELTALIPSDADDLETDPVAQSPTAMMFSVGPDSELDEEQWDKLLTVAHADRVGARIESEFDGTEPGGLAGRRSSNAEGESDDWRTEPSVGSLDLPSATFSEAGGISALAEPLGGGPELDKPLPDVSESHDDFDDTEPSEIGVPPMAMAAAEAAAKQAAAVRAGVSPFDALSSDDVTRVDPDVYASSPKPDVEDEDEDEDEVEDDKTRVDPPREDGADVILLEPKARKKRTTDQIAIPPLPHVEEPSVAVKRPSPPGSEAEESEGQNSAADTAPEMRPRSPSSPPGARRTRLSSAPPPAIRKTRLSSAPPPAVRKTTRVAVPPMSSSPSGVPEPKGRESSAPAPVPVVSGVPAPEPAPEPAPAVAPVAESGPAVAPVAESAPEYAPAPAPEAAPAPAPEYESARDRGPNPPSGARSGPKEVPHVMRPPAPAPDPESAPAPAPAPEPPDGFDSIASKELSIPPPPKVNSKLPAILIGLAAAAIVGSVVAFFVWPRGDDRTPTPASVVDAAPRPATTLSVTVEPPGIAEISIDGEAVTSPAPIEPGNRRIEVIASGYMTYIRDVDVVLDKPVELAVTMIRESGDAAAIAVDSEPSGLTIAVDGETTGEKTPAVVEIAAGPHALELLRDNQKVWETALVTRAATQHGLFAAIDPGAPTSDAGPGADAAPPATERSGAAPRIRARDGEVVPRSVRARVCIDRRGKVQSVRLFDDVTDRVRGKVVRTVEKWRYEPYLREHKPVPACFEEAIAIQIER